MRSVADPDNFAPDPGSGAKFRIRILLKSDLNRKKNAFFEIFIPFKVDIRFLLLKN